jgi:hypothetical protein
MWIGTTPWTRQQTFDLARAAVQVDFAKADAAQVEERVPRRPLDLDSPWVGRVDLDLPAFATAKPPDDHPLVADHGRRRCGRVMGDSEEPVHPLASLDHDATRTGIDGQGHRLASERRPIHESG